MKKTKYSKHNNPANKETVNVIITYDEFNLFLQRIPEQQAQHLQKLVQEHAFIQHHQKQGYFEGRDNIMLQLQYLVNKKMEDSHEITQLESNHDIEDCHGTPDFSRKLQINQLTYKTIVEKIYRYSCHSLNQFQVSINTRDNQHKMQIGRTQIVMTNVCFQWKKAFMIFEHNYQILQLLALIDQQTPLNSLQKVITDLEKDQKSNKFQTTLANAKKVFIFKRAKQEDWLQFIQIIDKKYEKSDIIVTSFKLFNQLQYHREYFARVNVLKVVCDEDDIRLAVNEISELKIHYNQKLSLRPYEELVIDILRHNIHSYRYKGTALDAITCYNIIQLQQRQTREFYFVERDTLKEKNQIQLVYFTFFDKLMRIDRDRKTSIVGLQLAKLEEYIIKRQYRDVYHQLKKHAVLNQLPFFSLCAQVAKIHIVNLQDLQTVPYNEINRLLFYHFNIAHKKYVVTLREQHQETEFFKQLEKPVKITFEKGTKVYKKMGALKSPGIISKKRIVENGVSKGQLEIQAEQGKLFIDTCLKQVTE